MNQDGLTDPRLNSAIDQAIRNGLASQDGCADLFEADLIISAEDNRHAVVEVSLTADQDDIDRVKTRADIMAAITEGAVTPVVITSRLNPAQSAPGGSGGSDHLRHTVSVSRARSLRNFPCAAISSGLGLSRMVGPDARSQPCVLKCLADRPEEESLIIGKESRGRANTWKDAGTSLLKPGGSAILAHYLNW